MASKKKTSVTHAPYDRNGNLMHFVYDTRLAPADGYDFGRASEWRDNEPFEATMTISGMQSGRSAKYLTLKDEHGHDYAMFVTDMIEAVRTAAGCQNGVFGHRRWIVSKRGSNYGVKIYEEG